MRLIAHSEIGLALLLAMASLPAGAQTATTQKQAQAGTSSSSSSNGPSLGDYARQVRKDPGTASKPKVFDNDNLPREDKLSVVGTPREVNDAALEIKQEEPAAAPGDSKSGAPAKPATEAKSGTQEDQDASKQAAWKQWGDKIAGQKDAIDLLQRELDVLQREYQIRAAAMYADVGNRLRNSTDWDKQDADYKQKIADKQKAVDDAKQKLDDMQEEARKAGVPTSIREP